MRLLSRLRYVLFTTLSIALMAQEATQSPTVFSLDEVVKLVRAGVPEELVIAQIKRYKKPFDLNSDEILELRKAGVSDTVIRYLVDPNIPYTPPPPPAAPAVPPPPKEPSGPPKDPLIAKIPPEPGLYWLSISQPGQEEFRLIELKAIVPLKPAGGMGSMFKGGLKKGQTEGFLVGGAGKQRARAGQNVFFGRLGAKIAIEDIVLLRMERHGEQRIIDFGPKPTKPVFAAESIHPFESKQLEDGLYRLDVPPLTPGEYVFLVLGSGDEKKGELGKGYDFGVDPNR